MATEELTKMVEENKCTRCARCCLIKRKVGRFWIVTDEYCKYYDKEKKICTTYYDRLDLKLQNKNNCLMAEDAKKLGLLPKDCGYCIGDKKYKSRVMNYGDKKRV